MSLGGPFDKTLNSAVAALSDIGEIPVVVAAGNVGKNVAYYSPASVWSAITVAASDEKDHLPAFSNWGVQIDIAAPGTDIISAWHTGNHIYAKQSGTSMASPLVAGAIALMMSEEEVYNGGKLCHKPGYFKSKVSSPAVKINGNYPLLYIGGDSYVNHASCSKNMEDPEIASHTSAERNVKTWTYKRLMENVGKI